MRSFYKNGQILFQDQWYENHLAQVDNNEIIAVVPESQAQFIEQEIIDLEGGCLVPSFVDLHVNGGGGVLLNNNISLTTLNKMSEAHQKVGTGYILPTLMTDHPSKISELMTVVEQSYDELPASVLGFHLEGPYISPARRGVHLKEYTRTMNQEDCTQLLQFKRILKDKVLLLTFAPEQVDLDLVKRLEDSGVVLSIGHSEATQAQLAHFSQIGYTHLFNAMPGLHHREDGPVDHCLFTKEAWCSLIADGYHVKPELLEMVINHKMPGNVILVSDAMAYVNGEDGYFDLYDQKIIVKDRKCVTSEGKLAGSAYALSDCVTYALKNCVNIPKEEIFKMASLYPAKLVGKSGLVTHGFNIFDREMKLYHFPN